LRCRVLQVQNHLLGNIVEFSAKALQGPQEIAPQRLSSMNGAFVRSCGGFHDILAQINKHRTGANKQRQGVLDEVVSS
jgi:hypothetical protein